MATPSSHHRRVPLSLREKLTVAGLGVAVVGAALVAWLAFRASARSEDPVVAVFDHLQHREFQAAFDLLAPALREEVGSAEALGRRWQATSVTSISLRQPCTSVGGDLDVVELHATVQASTEGTFELGRARGSCGRTNAGRTLLANVRDGQLIALRLTY